jgi:hypothetical protein
MDTGGGERGGEIHVDLSHSQAVAVGQIPMLMLMRVVERRAGSHPIETRLDYFLSGVSLVLRAEHFRDLDFEHGESVLD